MQTFGPLADSFAAGVPNARVVRIAHAKHAVFESNPTEVIDEINRFIGGLKNK
jgi:pimeloyl-ACP methyl ester carboxylesterase